MMKNLHANARECILIPGLGRFCAVWSNEARVPQLLAYALNIELTTREAHSCNEEHKRCS